MIAKEKTITPKKPGSLTSSREREHDCSQPERIFEESRWGGKEGKKKEKAEVGGMVVIFKIESGEGERRERAGWALKKDCHWQP